MSDAMKPGVFWAWRNGEGMYVKLSSDEPFLVVAGLATPKDSAAPCHGMGLAFFRRIFGIAPRPGEALKLDASAHVGHCPKCHFERQSYSCQKDYGYIWCPNCKESSPAGEWIYHARILERKALEEGK